jgi:hypothetical protein
MSFRLLIRVLSLRDGRRIESSSTLCVLFYKQVSHILIYIKQYATSHSLFYLETPLHVSGGTTTHHQEHKQLYLQHMVFVTPLLLPAARGR